MNGLLDTLVNSFGDDAVEMMSKQLGVENQLTKTALSSAIPMIVSALAKNASTQQGAESLHKAVVEDHDGSILDQLSDYIPNYQQSSGGGILGHVLGGNRKNVEDLIGQVSGMNPGAVSGFMEMLAPMIMGSLGKQQRNSNLNQGGLTDLLRQAQQGIDQKSQKGSGSILTSFLDKDGDGDIKDDLGRMAMNFLGNYFSGKK